MTMKDVLRIDAEILASEGIDPGWPGFRELQEETEPDSDRSALGLTCPLCGFFLPAGIPSQYLYTKTL